MFSFFLEKSKGQHLKISVFYLMKAIISGISFTTSIVLGNLIDHLTHFNTSEALKYIIVLLLFGFSEIVLNYFVNKVYMILQISIGNTVCTSVIKHLNLVESYIHRSDDTAKIVQKINIDSNSVVIFSLEYVSMIITSSFLLVISLIVLLYINIFIFIHILIILTLYIFSYYFLRSRYYSKSYSFKEKQAAYFESQFNLMKMAKFMATHNLFNYFYKKSDRAYRDVYEESLKYQQISYFYTGIGELIRLVGIMTLYLISGIFVLSSEISLGKFVITLSVFEIVLNSCNVFFEISKMYQNSLSSYNRIMEYLNETRFLSGNIEFNNVESIRVVNCSFHYQEKLIIKKFNYNFKKGILYCISDDNGAGKSTLLECLLGYHQERYEGDIFVGGTSIGDLSLSIFRERALAYVSQTPVVIEGDYITNITLMVETFKNEFIEELCRIFEVSLTDYIGRDYIGGDISGGEAQKITILRALLKDTPILLLDEPTSSLDYKSKVSLMNYLNCIKNEKIIILVSHDAEVVTRSDEVLKISGNSYLEKIIS